SLAARRGSARNRPPDQQDKAVIEREFRPGIETTERNYRYAGWKKAVKRAMAWEEHDE
ncbi:hypothetical protein ACUOCP_06915, partial [Escherichia sp. R-CC3]